MKERRKLAKTDMPQRRHGDPPEPTFERTNRCRCDLDDRDGTNHLRYTGEVRRTSNGVLFGLFDCPHGNRWSRLGRNRRKVAA